MKKIVLENPEIKVVALNSLMGVEIVAYRCPNSSSVCVLTKLLDYQWGFINLNSSGSKPTFVNNDFFSAVRLALTSRDLRTFSGQDDLIRAIYKKEF